MKKNHDYNILIGPQEIAGYYTNLAKGFKSSGITCDYITYHDHPFSYGGETKEPKLLKVAKLLFKISNNENLFLKKRLIYILAEVLTIFWAIPSMFKYDVFIFGFGKSLLRSNIDLPILKFLNKVVISNLAHGSESRPAFIDGSFYEPDISKSTLIKRILNGTSSSMKLVRWHEKYSTVLIGGPYVTNYFASKKFINSFALGIPIDFKSYTSNSQTPINFGKCRILHSPSHPTLKGTTKIINAIDNLKRRGFDIDLILIHGKTHSEVIKEIMLCDFVVDQLYSDTPLAGFATEAAWFGKAAVVGGYRIDSLKKFVPKDMWPPSKTCHPDDIEKTIEELITNKEERLQLGISASEFVKEKWNSYEVAKRYKRIIDGLIPDEWWFEPKDVIYLEGCGQPIEITKSNIKDILNKKGINSLHLNQRSELEMAFVKFATLNEIN